MGDHLEGDALGARDAGMVAFWLCPKSDPVDVPAGVTRIRTLSELPALLQV